MWNFKWNRKQVPKYLKRNKTTSGPARTAGKAPVPGSPAPSARSASAELERVQKNIARQALLAGLTVVLTIVILFAMTSAWYTNIVQTSGLTFEAESWGFDGQITVNEDAIVAAPGEEGLVHLEVKNTSSNVSAISVNVNKETMEEDMRKRLFFYVDTHMNRDGETMERVYLNMQESYTYTVFSKGTLTLTEKISNAPQLKWQWVYDMLGYYVLAEPIYDTDGKFMKMQIYEYLRPIEYDYDQATMRMVKNEEGNFVGEILTVDGKNSPAEYLEIISRTDGYEGTMNRNAQIKGYYPVDGKMSDKMGYGIYAYLCSYSEIEQATSYDTMLGDLAYQQNVQQKKLDEKTAERLQFKATLNISAQQNESTAINVTNLTSLRNTIAAGKADVIQLSDDITIPSGESLTIPKNTRVMVDMNGKTITCQSDKAINAEPGSSLTLRDGIVTGPGFDSTTYGVYSIGAEVVMSNVAMSNFRYGVFTGDHAVNNALDSRIHMVGCTVDAEWYSVYINGNGPQSNQKTQLIIENTTLTGGGYAITGSGNGDRSGTDIQILNSVVSQRPNTEEKDLKPGAGIFHPQKNSTLYIEKSTVSGYTAIALKGGLLDIMDSNISGKGLESITPEKPSGSGFVDTADAVYIEANYGNEIGLTISGDSVLTSDKGQSLRVFPADAANVDVTIYSGTFDESQAGYLAEGSTQTTAGNTWVVTAPAK